MRSAPGTRADSTILFGRLRSPPKPPPTKPLRTLVTWKISGSSSNNRRCASSIAASSSLRSEHGDVVALEHRRVRIAREPLGVLEHAELPTARAACTSVDGELPLRLRRDQPPEVRQAPRDRDRRRLRRSLDARKRTLERHACFAQRRRCLGHAQPRRDHAMVERRHEKLDSVVDHRLRVRQEMLLDGLLRRVELRA